MSKWPKVNRQNWRSLTKENKKLFKQIMRDIHDDILEDIATCQRLKRIYVNKCYRSYPFLNGDYEITLDGQERR